MECYFLPALLTVPVFFECPSFFSERENCGWPAGGLKILSSKPCIIVSGEKINEAWG